MQITHTPNVIGAHITQVDLANLSDADFAIIEKTFNERSVICIRDQKLTERQLVDFAKRFGSIEPHFLKHYTHPDHSEIQIGRAHV